jgi:hypothetical protein
LAEVGKVEEEEEVEKEVEVVEGSSCFQVEEEKEPCSSQEVAGMEGEMEGEERAVVEERVMEGGVASSR